MVEQGIQWTIDKRWCVEVDAIKGYRTRVTLYIGSSTKYLCILCYAIFSKKS
jgi:hypothetical protein